MTERKVEVKMSDISEEMQNYAIECATTALDKFVFTNLKLLNEIISSNFSV